MVAVNRDSFNSPDSNRGVDTQKTGKVEPKSSFAVFGKIDWLSITVHPSKTDMTALYPQSLSKDWMTCPPSQGYAAACQYSDGRRENINPDRPEMGCHVVFSGQTLNRIQDATGIDGLELLRHYVTIGANITRLDLAIDAHDSGIQLDTLKELFDAGKAKTRALRCGVYKGNGEFAGQTLEIGSRTSEAYLRCYDKAAEQNVHRDWLRFEIELKSVKALAAARVLISSSEPYKLIQSLIKGHCDFVTDELWCKVMSEAPQVLSRAKETGSDTRRWLLKTCVPALAKLAVFKDDQTIVAEFIQALSEELADLRDKVQSGSFLAETFANRETFLPGNEVIEL